MKYPLSPLGFTLYSIDDCQIGWAIELDENQKTAVINTKKDYEFIRKFITQAAITHKYTANAIANIVYNSRIEGFHIYDQHPRGWYWDVCTHPQGHCQGCNIVLIVHRDFDDKSYC